ncbi:(2Fe-2S) ferredoxin domain-containing protein [Paramaledivibacter caminithermalis]|jgi:NADP-reducing hydrogenase subunit HndB|uniref:NADP-reducing hydrogenase subunit HndB n=1 Tax=Paramaledivibacter caminithermalis (strain DSM 15212 / CIP 107654 / DViRD3) TaxID=1121301 RepID=A0A1M6LSA4_PARC5|nr:(2Fe-2S) ferredoxin domain-containing protein [Paramaledivibacter caminithermalis]SHJ74124.1 NADP-reducing hydrogenase subunit HndB [Paramaledivibacter caminithermalis DSM 15212]
MKVKSLEELKKIREESMDKVNLREHGEINEDKIEILVGMATCGISSGARETLNEFVEEIKKEKLNNVKVIPVGCIGYCHSEPTVQVNISGEKPVLYGNVKGKRVHEIIEKHIKGGKPVENLILHVDFERA